MGVYVILYSSQDCPGRLRRIGYRDPETGKHYVFLTNHFNLSAVTIAKIYKSRWQIELFFKWIKQNLKIKSFFGTSRNAVMTQIWIAMCIYLLLSIVSKVPIEITEIVTANTSIVAGQFIRKMVSRRPCSRSKPNYTVWPGPSNRFVLKVNGTVV